MHIKSVFFSGTVASLLLVTGCTVEKPLKMYPRLLQSGTAQLCDDALIVSCQMLSHEESVQQFGYEMQAYGYQPLVLQVENTGVDIYSIRPSYIHLPLISGKHVAKSLQYDAVSWIAWTAIPSLIFLWPLIPCVVVPMGVSMVDHNRRIKNTLKKRSFGPSDEIELLPGERVCKYLFVPENYYATSFMMSVYNVTQQRLAELKVRCC